MKKSEKMIIYNLFPLLAGKFTDWEEHFTRASEMGFNWIFVNPIQYPGFSGSLYSIKDYFNFNPLVIDNEAPETPGEQLKQAIKIAEKYGMRVMVDLVINHCAVDSPLIKEHPEWFQWDKKGRIVHPSCNENGKKVVWGDLAKFDHKNTKDKEGLFLFLVKVLEFLIDLGFSGFRCDAAYQLPANIWEKLISEIRSRYPRVIFFAETLGCSPEATKKTANAGFDYIFNSSKWWDFHGSWLLAQYNLTREVAPSVSFPESHDTLRLSKEFQGNINALKQRYLFSALFSAGVMAPMGFEFGFRKRLHVVKTRPTDWEKTEIDLTGFIKEVNAAKEKFPVFREESLTIMLNSVNPNILFMWKAAAEGGGEALIILNKDIHNKQNFYSDNLYQFVHTNGPLVDASPEYRLDYIPTPFSYDLRPGQGIVLMTTTDREG